MNTPTEMDILHKSWKLLQSDLDENEVSYVESYTCGKYEKYT